MTKLNNKGFAISVILYAMVILAMGIFFLLIDIVNTRYRLSKDMKEDVVEYINSQGVNTITSSLANKIATTKIINTGSLTYQNGNYYYYGNEPNNYVIFNSELWRIIGVINVDGVKYLKIVRKDYLQSMTSNSNRIIDSNIFEYLNDNYYNTIANRTMIKKMDWYNSEYSTNRTVSNAFNQERSATSMSNNYIGLINGSDFGYAAGTSYFTNNLSNYAPSINNNWLSLTNTYFTMSFQGTNLNVVSNGNLVSTSDFEAYVYPCLYLKKDLLITSGTGHSGDPYILSLS